MSTDNESPRILRVAETTSTNSLLRELVIKESLLEGSVVVADFQTAGRGQIGNVWESEAGKNLMFSTVLYPTCIPANRQFLISQIAALSVKETLDLYTDHVTVKWPNDIYWKDKKICGMLIENDLSGHNLYCSIIGIGINLNQAVFRGDAPNPVSLFQIIGKEVDREEVLDRFLSVFYRYYLSLLQEEYEDMLEELLDRFGEPPKSVLNLLEIASVKALAHSAYVTEVSEKADFIRFTLYEKAAINPAGIPGLVEEWKGLLKFTVDTRPYFLYQRKKNNRQAKEDTMEIVKKVLLGIKALVDEKA